MNLMTMIYTNAMAESVAFFEQAGLTRDGDGPVDQWWNQFTVGDAVLALHWNEDKPLENGTNPQLHIHVSPEDVDRIHAHFKTTGVEMSPEPYELGGMDQRTFFVTDPNGIKVFFNG